ncbi:hypothetical protein Tco_0359594 [Tanacetum coccineum]
MKSLNTSTDSKSKLLNRDPWKVLNQLGAASNANIPWLWRNGYNYVPIPKGFHVKPTTDGFCTGAIENRYIQCALQDVRSREATQEKQTMRCNVYGSTRSEETTTCTKGFTPALWCVRIHLGSVLLINWSIMQHRQRFKSMEGV